MLKTLNTRISVQNDKFSTKNVEKTVDKSKSMWYYMQAFRKDAKRCWKVNQKKFWKTFKKVLTNERVCDILLELSTSENFKRERKESRKDESEKVWKNLKKLSKKYWQIEKSVIYSLSCLRERASDWTLKIKQRDKKRNPRFDDTRYHQEEFLKVLFKQ